jgi:hypothetical protein
MRNKGKRIVSISKKERENPENNKIWLWTIHYHSGAIVKKRCSYIQLLENAGDNYIANCMTY